MAEVPLSLISKISYVTPPARAVSEKEWSLEMRAMSRRQVEGHVALWSGRMRRAEMWE